MIVYVNTSGTAISVQPSPVYQGSSLSGALYFVAPFPTTNAVSVAFTLPNGDATKVYPMTSVAELPGVMDGLGDEFSVWEWQVDDALITTHAGTVTAQFAVTYNGKPVTTAAINFTVQEGVFPLPPDEPSADEWQTLINLYGKLSGRVTALEDREQQKVLVDFTVDDTTGKGIKYYSDGSTAMVQFPTGGEAPSGASGLLKIMSFTSDSWVESDSGVYELAFGAQQTGFANSDYVAMSGINGSATYEAGTETTASEREGLFTLADSIFQGSDGSMLLTANAPYAGRVAVIGGDITLGQTVTDAAYDLTTHILTISFANGSKKQIPFETNVSQFNNDAGYQTAAEVQAAVSSEESARKAADEQLQSQITQNTGNISTLETGLDEANTAIDGLRADIDSKEHFRGYYATTAEVLAITDPSSGDYAYNAQTGTKWVYGLISADTYEWVDTHVEVPDQVTPKSTTTPLMDGTAAVGAENAYAAGDHRHPTDTTRAAASALNEHVADKNNPHEVTPAQIGAQPAGNYVTVENDAAVYDYSGTLQTLSALASAVLAAHPKVLRVSYTSIPTSLITPPTGLNYGNAFYLFRVLARQSMVSSTSTLAVIEVTFENVSTSTTGIRPVGYIRQGKGGSLSTWWWSGWTSDEFQEKLVSGTNIKTVNGASLLGSGNIVINTEVTKYAYTTTTDDWTAQTGGKYTYTISANTHGVGIYPVVTVFNNGAEVSLGVSVDSSGNVTLTSTTADYFEIIIV